MSRQLRIDEPGAWHHVMQRGAGKRSVFRDDVDRANLSNWIDAGTARHEVEVHGWALMGNHYHLLVRCPSGGLSQAMHLVNGAYAQAFNRRHGVTGPLFGGRFKSIVVGSPDYLVELVRYIHRNPVNANLADTAANYKWSSHRSYLGGAGEGPATVTGELLGYFGGDVDRFDRFVNAPDSVQARHVLEAIDSGAPALGPPDFIDEIVNETPIGSATVASVRQLKRRRSEAEIGLIEQWVAIQFGSSLEQLTTFEPRVRNDGLAVLVTTLQRQGLCSHAEAAARYDFVSRQSVASLVRRTELRAACDSELRRLLESAPRTLRSAS